MNDALSGVLGSDAVQSAAEAQSSLTKFVNSLSLTRILTAVVLLLVCAALIRLVQGAAKRLLARSHIETRLHKLILAVTRGVMIFIAVMLLAGTLGVDTSSLLALLIPVVGGILFGLEFVGGLLVGATIVAIPRAIFMGNSGGAFDNAKKYIEGGFLDGHGKGSAAHKASVTGDTVGDTRKDVVGVALDIFIKMMSTVANTLATVIGSIRLFK